MTAGYYGKDQRQEPIYILCGSANLHNYQARLHTAITISEISQLRIKGFQTTSPKKHLFHMHNLTENL